MTNTIPPTFPEPAGAVRVDDEWLLGGRTPEGGPDVWRYFEGSSWIIERDNDDIEVKIRGLQHADRHVDREIAVGPLHPDIPISAAQARQLARALIAAADELERMDEADEAQGSR